MPPVKAFAKEVGRTSRAAICPLRHQHHTVGDALLDAVPDGKALPNLPHARGLPEVRAALVPAVRRGIVLLEPVFAAVVPNTEDPHRPSVAALRPRTHRLHLLLVLQPRQPPLRL
eukprot:3222009-Prymnesium_polylepis.1